jgi:hypothetical protein
VEVPEVSLNTIQPEMESPVHQAEELQGLLFSTAKDLRHQAEQTLGELFVPTEVVSAGENSADIVLRPSSLGEIHVHAERERHWYPYQVTRVDTVER